MKCESCGSNYLTLWVSGQAEYRVIGGKVGDLETEYEGFTPDYEAVEVFYCSDCGHKW